MEFFECESVDFYPVVHELSLFLASPGAKLAVGVHVGLRDEVKWTEDFSLARET